VSTPGLGAALRVAHDVVREDIFERVRGAGHPGFTRATFPLWRFEGLEGRRPGEIARTSGLSKQAVNDQLRALERLGYVERHADPRDGRGRVVRLTERGRELDDAVRSAAGAVEDAWARDVGDAAWEDFRAVLDRIAGKGYPAGAGAGDAHGDGDGDGDGDGGGPRRRRVVPARRAR